MVKAIIFDFDGIIVESADIKTEAFRELFSPYAGKVEKIVEYHLENGGISRYIKFRHIYRNILKKDLSKKEELALGKRFSKIALGKVLAAPFVSGAKEFLKAKKGFYKFFIASGTPDEELHHIVGKRNISNYFDEIHGSPPGKSEIIRDIIKRHHLAADEVVYVGDTKSDLAAAEEAGVRFIGRHSGESFSILMSAI